MTRKMRNAIALSALALTLTAGASRGSAAVNYYVYIPGPSSPGLMTTILGLVLTLVP